MNNSKKRINQSIDCMKIDKACYTIIDEKYND